LWHIEKNGGATPVSSFTADAAKRRLQWLRLCSCTCREQPDPVSQMDTKIYYEAEKA